MAHKSNAVVREVLAHLDEKLIPPELLAVPQRHASGPKIAGASSRLYNADQIQKRRERDLAAKQALLQQQEHPEYDSTSDRHLRRFWRKRGVVATPVPAASSEGARSFTPNPLATAAAAPAAASGKQRQPQRGSIVQIHSRPLSAADWNGHGGGGGTGAGSRSTSGRLLLPAIVRQQPTRNSFSGGTSVSSSLTPTTASSASSGRRNDADARKQPDQAASASTTLPAIAGASSSTKPAAAAADAPHNSGRASSAGSFWSSTSSSSSSSSSSSVTPSSSARSSRNGARIEAVAAAENDGDNDEYGDDFEDIEDETIEHEEQQQQPADDAPKAAATDQPQQQEKQRDAVALSGRGDDHQQQPATQQQEPKAANGDTPAAAAVAASPSASSPDVSPQKTHGSNEGESPTSNVAAASGKKKPRSKRAAPVGTKNYVLLNSSKPLPVDAASPDRGHVPLTAETLLQMQTIASGADDFALAAASAAALDGKSAAAAAAAARRRELEEADPLMLMGSSAMDGVSNLSLPSIPVRDRHHHVPRHDAIKRIRRLAAAYSQLDSVRDNIKAMMMVRGDIEQQQPQQVRSSARAGCSSRGEHASGLAHASGFAVTDGVRSANAILPPPCAEGDEPLPARHISEQQQQQQRMGKPPLSRRPESAAMTLHSLEPHIKSSEVLILCQFVGQGGNTASAVSSLTKTLSLEWMLSGKSGASGANSSSFASPSAVAAGGSTFDEVLDGSNNPVQRSLEDSLRPVVAAALNDTRGRRARHQQRSGGGSSSAAADPSMQSASSSRTFSSFSSSSSSSSSDDDSFERSSHASSDDGKKQPSRHQLPEAAGAAAAEDPDFESPQRQQQQQQRRPASVPTSDVPTASSPGSARRRTVHDLAQSVRDGTLFESRPGNKKNPRLDRNSHRVSSPRSAVAMMRHGVSFEVLTSGVHSGEALLRSSPYQKRVAEHAESAKRFAASELVAKCVAEYDRIVGSGVTRAAVVAVVRAVAPSLGIVPKRFGEIPASVRKRPPPAPQQRASSANSSGPPQRASAVDNSVLALLPSPLRPVSADSPHGEGSAQQQQLIEYSPSFLKRQRILDLTFRAEARSVLRQFDRLIAQEEQDKAAAERVAQLQREKVAALREQGERNRQRTERAKRFKQEVSDARRGQVVDDIVEGIESAKVVSRFIEARRLALTEQRAMDEAERTCARRARLRAKDVDRAVRAAAKEAERSRVAERKMAAAADFEAASVRRRHQEQVTGHQVRKAQRSALDDLRRELAVAASDARSAEVIAAIHNGM